MISSGKTGSHVDLKDDQDRKVGQLSVWRHEQYQNPSYAGCYFSIDDRDKAMRGLKGDKINDARRALDLHENRVLERIVNGGVITEKGRILIMQHVLYELGIRKSKPKAA